MNHKNMRNEEVHAITGNWTVYTLGEGNSREFELLENRRYREEGSSMEYRWDFDVCKSTFQRQDTAGITVEGEVFWLGSHAFGLVSMGKPVEVWIRKTGSEQEQGKRQLLDSVRAAERARASKVWVRGADDLLKRSSLGERDFRASAQLRSALLAGAYLPYVDLRETDLSHADLSGAVLFEAKLSRANLRTADLDRADLRGAAMRGVTLTGASLAYAILGPGIRPVTLVGGVLRGADLSGASLIRADLRDADLSRANLSQANLSGTDLLNAKLRGANLDDANLSNANLHGADLSEVSLTEAQRAQVSLVDTSKAISPDQPEWKPGRSWPELGSCARGDA